MQFFLLTIFISLLAFGQPRLDGRIIGGEDASIEAYPYLVSIRLGNTTLKTINVCGGSILNSTVILTAGHCIYTNDPSFYTVQYGLSKIGGDKNVIEVERVVAHENFNRTTFRNDVALIFLKSKIPLGPNARPIKLGSKNPTPGTKAAIAGWGILSEEGGDPSILQSLTTIIKDKFVCSIQYIEVQPIYDGMLCAGIEGGGHDACQGDSGGPLVANGKQIGIISWGTGCGRPEYFGLFSSIEYFQDWIIEHLK